MNRVVLRNLTSVLVAAAVVLSAADVLACPSCKAALASSEGQGNWVGGFFWSILFMLSMPIAIVTAWGVSVYRMVRKARRESPAERLPDAPRGQNELVKA
jgi:hypothetical protein